MVLNFDKGKCENSDIENETGPDGTIQMNYGFEFRCMLFDFFDIYELGKKRCGGGMGFYSDITVASIFC